MAQSEGYLQNEKTPIVSRNTEKWWVQSNRYICFIHYLHISTQLVKSISMREFFLNGEVMVSLSYIKIRLK